LRVAALIRCGELCGTCTATRCEDNNVRIACPNCNEKGCERCENTGYFWIKECPQNLIDSNTKEAINYTEWMDKGFLPVNGGLLDQSASLVEHCKFYSDERNRIEAERYKK
jgi:hypothetical protein